MIEDGLFLLLGFCLATLIALAILPVVWGRALRLTRERLARLVPGSQDEIDAIHDGLRAQAAVAHRRLEQRIETEERATTHVKVELGHRTVRLAAAEEAGEALRTERRALLSEIDDQSRDLRDVDGQRVALEKALHDADTNAENATAAAAEAGRRLAEATAIGKKQDAVILTLEAKLAALTTELANDKDRIRAMETVAAQHATTERAVEAAFELKRHEAERLKSSLDAVQAALQQERAEALEARNLMQQHHSEAARAMETRVAEQDASSERSRIETATLKLRIEALEAQLTARAERPPDDQAEAAEEDAVLRSAIVAIGDDALRHLAPAEAVPEPDGARKAALAGGAIP